jgi:hypothetical protein
VLGKGVLSRHACRVLGQAIGWAAQPLQAFMYDVAVVFDQT